MKGRRIAAMDVNKWDGRAAAALALLALAPLLLFWPCLAGGRYIWGFDLVPLGIPFSAAIRRSLAAGQWPLWIPDLLGGMPGVAACNLQFLYPTDILSSLAGWTLPAQLGLDAAAHLALAGLGTFLLLRRLGRSVPASLLGGLFFAFSGTEATQLNGGFYNFVEGIALVPWAFWAAHKARSGGSWQAWALCGLAFALQILAEAAQVCAYTILAVAALVLAWPGDSGGGLRGREGLLRAAAGLALALALAALLAAPQVLLTLQYLPLAQRGSGSWAGFVQGSPRLLEALACLVPGSFGWQSPSYYGARESCFTSEYIGLLPLALSAAALAALARREAWVRWMAGLALGTLVLAQRHWTPLHYLLQHLPVLSGFRFLGRILFLCSLAASVLAAYGWDALVQGSRRAAALRGALALPALALAAAAWVYVQAPARAAAAAPGLGDFTAAAGGPVPAAGLLQAMARDSAVEALALALVLAALLWALARRLGPAPALAMALAFHAADQGPVLARYIRFVDPAQLAAKPAFSPPPPPPPGLEPWRVYDSSYPRPNDTLLLGYENAFGRESMPLRSSERMLQAMYHRWQDWAGLYGVRYIFVHERGAPGAPGSAVAIYGNPGACPRAFFVDRVRLVSGDEEAWRLLADKGFDPRREVALQSDPWRGAGGPDAAGPLAAPADPAAGGVQWLSRSPQTASLRVETPRDRVLVVSNSWYPSWRAAIDGLPAPMLKADGGLQAVAVRAGRHVVDLSFDTGLFTAGCWTALGGLLALLAFACAPFFRQKPC